MKSSCVKVKRSSCHIVIQVLFVSILCTSVAECGNKYSAEANNVKPKVTTEKIDLSYFRNLQKPFRMAKLNMLWSKAQLRLTESKLKSLFSELKIHDKEEITYKKFKAEDGDKDGLKEAELRKKLIGIMSTYDLLEHFEDVQGAKKLKEPGAFNEASDDHINKMVFQDKKLNKLWLKAERSGFTAAELKALHEEFKHHQDKIEEYQSLIQKDAAANTIDEDHESFNELEHLEEKDRNHHSKANKLRDHHKTIIDGYDRLNRLAAQGPANKDFVEPKVQGLWRIATNANFTAHELESLKVELLHYENRLLKLRHLQAEAEMSKDRMKESNMKPSEAIVLHMDKIKKQVRKAEKLHLDLETRIMERHVEL